MTDIWRVLIGAGIAALGIAIGALVYHIYRLVHRRGMSDGAAAERERTRQVLAKNAAERAAVARALQKEKAKSLGVIREIDRSTNEDLRRDPPATPSQAKAEAEARLRAALEAERDDATEIGDDDEEPTIP